MSKLTKGTLSKSGLSMGSIEKTAMPQLKEGSNYCRTTNYHHDSGGCLQSSEEIRVT